MIEIHDPQRRRTPRPMAYRPRPTERVVMWSGLFNAAIGIAFGALVLVVAVWGAW